MVISLWILTFAYTLWALLKRATGLKLAFLPAVWLLGSDFSAELTFAVMLPLLIELKPVPLSHPRRIGALVSAVALITLHGWEALLHSPRHTLCALLTLAILGLARKPKALRAALGFCAFWALYFSTLALLGY
jgi:hypothetical protein